jgi:lysophospholipase L1-like esterase
MASTGKGQSGCFFGFRRGLLWALTAVLMMATAACSDGTDGSTGVGGSTAKGGSSAGGGNRGGSSGSSGGASSTLVSSGSSGGSTSASSFVSTASGGSVSSGGTTNSETGGTSRSGGTTGSGGITGSAGAKTGGSTSTGAGSADAGVAGADGGQAGQDGGLGGQDGSGGAGGATTGTGGARPDGGPGGSSGTAGSGGGFQPCPAGAACAVMPVGDSITEGCCTAPMGGYRIELYHQALTNKKDITFVGTLTNGPSTVDGQKFPQSHEGHGGWKINQIAGVIDNAISKSKPNIVILKIGTNDINGNDNVTDAPNRLDKLITQITTDAPSALLVVSAIIPTTSDGVDAKVQTYNAAIKVKAESAAAAGKHVVFVDNHAPFMATANWKTALMADGLHPNTAGYAILGQSFYKVISALLPAAP